MSEQFELSKLIFGRLSWESIPLHDPIILATFVMVLLGGGAIVGALTYYKVRGSG